jgi:ABC-2 type transport system permease protein
VIPVGFIVTLPAQVFLGGANTALVLGGAALAVFLFLLSSALFKLSLRKYTSASS